MKNIDDNIIKALTIILPKTKIPKKINNLKMGDLKEWDSLAHFHLILQIEKIFNYRFSSSVFPKLNTIKSIKKNLFK